MGFATRCTECPAGYYCETSRKNSVPLPCAAGTYSNKSATVCTQCDPGYACKGSNTSPKPPSGLCPLGYNCPDGLREVDCPAGTFGNITGAASEAEGCPDCPAGYFCPARTRGYPAHRCVFDITIYYIVACVVSLYIFYRLCCIKNLNVRSDMC